MGSRAIPVGYGLDDANVYAADLGAPALAVVDRYVASVAMGNKTYTLANSGLPGDGLARNCTVKRVVVVVGADTPGKITIAGTDVSGNAISEEIIPGADGVTVAGLKAFKTVTSVIGSGWTAAGGADTIEVGFGTCVGLPPAIRRRPAIDNANHIPLAFLDATPLVPVVHFDADAADLSACTVDASAGTYNGTKHLIALVLR